MSDGIYVNSDGHPCVADGRVLTFEEIAEEVIEGNLTCPNGYWLVREMVPV